MCPRNWRIHRINKTGITYWKILVRYFMATVLFRWTSVHWTPRDLLALSTSPCDGGSFWEFIWQLPRLIGQQFDHGKEERSVCVSSFSTGRTNADGLAKQRLLDMLVTQINVWPFIFPQPDGHKIATQSRNWPDSANVRMEYKNNHYEIKTLVDGKELFSLPVQWP